MDDGNYVWVTSGRLRNPRELAQNYTHSRQGAPLKSGRRITRRLKSISSDDLFQNHRPPAYIDHYGNAIPCGEFKPCGDSDLNAVPRDRLLRLDANSKFHSASQTQSEPGMHRQSCLKSRFVSKRPSTSMDHWSVDLKSGVRPSASRLTISNLVRSSSPMLERPQPRGRSRDSRPKTSLSVRPNSNRKEIQSPWRNQQTLVSESLHEEDEDLLSTKLLDSDLPFTRKSKIRPITAVYDSLKAKRFLEERLRTIYRQKRATSAASRIQNWRYSNDGQTSSSATDRCQTSANGVNNTRHLARFRLIGRVAIYLRRLMQAIVENSKDKSHRSATELQWMAVYSENHDESLAFNKHLFSRDRVSTHVPDWAMTILSLPPEERTEYDCRRLHALLRGLRSFDKFTEEMQMSLCRAFTLERVEEGRVVLKSGHIGMNFYFIYSGSVFVNSEDVTTDGKKFMRTVALLCRGDSFGELALLQDIRRTATISVREKCELLVVDKDIFASVCPKIFEKELSEKQNFISTLDLFSSSFWSLESLHSLCMNAQIQEVVERALLAYQILMYVKSLDGVPESICLYDEYLTRVGYKINKVIVANSSVEDWIYACMQGKCRAIRCVSLDEPPKEASSKRKQSDVVLSEEILQLLAAATDQQGNGHSVDEGDMKENLLTSLGLDYVQTSKKLYLDKGDARERKRAILGLNETTTLTAIIKKETESNKEVVFLDVGVIESGEIFDLPSLLENPESESASTLMLVSGGAKILRIKKAAFFDQATQQALDNTRTLASKQKNPSQQTILASYKVQLKWDQYKARLVKSIVKSHDPFLPTADVRNVRNSLRAQENLKAKIKKNLDKRKAPSSLKTEDSAVDNSLSNEEAENGDERIKDQINLIGRRRKSNYYEEIDPVENKEIKSVIIRRKPSALQQQVRVSKISKEDDLCLKINSLHHKLLDLQQKR